MNFEQTPEFKKDLKKLSKKWRSLKSDLDRAEPVINSLYVSAKDVSLKLFREQFFQTNKAAIIVQPSETVEVIKMRLDTDAPGSRNKVRIVFVAVRSSQAVTYIELYAKNQQERENMNRINSFLAQIDATESD